MPTKSKKYSKELSIIIVEYKSGKYLQALLKMLPKKKTWEVIVIENTNNNIGYGAGCNAGATKAHGKHLLFLNPDVGIDEKAIQELLTCIKKNPDVGVVGPKYVNALGETELASTQHITPVRACIALSWLNKFFPQNRFSRAYWMKDWDRESSREVDVISGAAMMIRSDIFHNIGGFDTRFFLYWEEFDLCKRVVMAGKKVLYCSFAVATHPRQVSVRNADVQIEKIFRKSRSLYFSKYFGKMISFFLTTWFFVTEEWRMLFLVGCSLFLRLFNIQRIRFIGDLGRDYNKALDMLQGISFPVLGIPSSIPRFFQGPFTIWFNAISFLIGGVSPFSPVIFSAGLTTFGIGLLYLLLQKHVDKNSAFVGALFLAFSPAALFQSRMPFYLFAVPLFTTMYLWNLDVLEKKKAAQGVYVFFAVLSFFLLFQWELAVLPLFSILFFVFWRNKHAVIPHWKSALLGVFLGGFPQIIYDLTHKCSQLCGLAFWSVYRVAAITGFDNKHGYSLEKMLQLSRGLSIQFQNLLGIQERISLPIFFILTGYVLFRFIKMKTKPRFLQYAIFGSLALLLGIVIHGTPSEAYFPPFLIFFSIFFAYFFYFSSRKVRIVFLGLFLLLASRNSYLLIKNFFYTKSIQEYVVVSKQIVLDALGKEILLRSNTSYPQFATHLDHYKFLIRVYKGKLGYNGNIYVVTE